LNALELSHGLLDPTLLDTTIISGLKLIVVQYVINRYEFDKDLKVTLNWREESYDHLLKNHFINDNNVIA